MIKIAIIGAAGRMGRELVTAVVNDPETKLCGAIDHSECPLLGQDAGVTAGCGATGIKITADIEEILPDADAIIDFSSAESTVSNAKMAFLAHTRVVIGTTGLDDNSKNHLTQLAEQGARIVFAPNMSVGVNLLFSLCERAAKALGDGYDIEVLEMHHNQKKDAPSGTAARLGEILADATGRDYDRDAVHGREGMVGARKPNEIGMHALRGGDVVGDHTVIFATGGERVELTHKASSRQTFAKGAVRAVKFLTDAEPGLYDMQDVLRLR
jgi:4-hydroxy-tetrahydrodipicolinate reductase